MKVINGYLVFYFLFVFIPSGHASVVDELLNEYKSAQSLTFKKSDGRDRWTQKFIDSATGERRSCADCHTDNLRAVGRHIRTKKAIDPLAPSINNRRLTEIKRVKKWFKRNCKWTIGRECTNQEKGDFLMFINSL